MNESGKGSTLRAVLLWGVPLAAVAVGLAVWALGGRYVETDNAYVKADLVPLYPEIEAQVTEVLVAENARVEAGQVLLKLDPAAGSPRHAAERAQAYAKQHPLDDLGALHALRCAANSGSGRHDPSVRELCGLARRFLSRSPRSPLP